MRLFASVADHLTKRASLGPVLLCFDDLQWSDAASNELLRYVLIHAGSIPLMVLADDGRLDPRQEKNPDPCAETLELPVPRSVVTVIARRLGRASENCREVLEIAALSGNRVSVDLLAGALRLSPVEVVESLEEAVTLALVQALSRPADDDADSVDDYAFLHDRIRETIGSAINPVRRRDLHERIATALETLIPGRDEPSRLSAITHHLRHARQHERAAQAAERLGDDVVSDTNMTVSINAKESSEMTKNVIERFNEAFNRHDVDTITALMTDDCVFENSSPAPDGKRFEGHDEVRAFWERMFRGTPSAKFETEDMFVAGDRCSARWRYTYTGENGEPRYIRGVDVFRVRDGKVAEKLAYVKG